jgi:hypothetical protein
MAHHVVARGRRAQARSRALGLRALQANSAALRSLQRRACRATRSQAVPRYSTTASRRSRALRAKGCGRPGCGARAARAAREAGSDGESRPTESGHSLVYVARCCRTSCTKYVLALSTARACCRFESCRGAHAPCQPRRARPNQARVSTCGFRRERPVPTKGPRMAKSIAFAADASRLTALLLSYIPARMSPSSRLASRAPRPRSSTDLAIRGP